MFVYIFRLSQENHVVENREEISVPTFRKVTLKKSDRWNKPVDAGCFRMVHFSGAWTINLNGSTLMQGLCGINSDN